MYEVSSTQGSAATPSLFWLPDTSHDRPGKGAAVTAARAAAIIALAATTGGQLGAAEAAEARETCVTAKCHTQMQQGAGVHEPVKTGRCDRCHTRRFGKPGVPHVRGQMTLPAATRKLCLPCHSAIKKQLDQPHQHRPVARINCGFCHAPHKSSRPHLLRSFRKLEGGGPFCYLCHDQRAFRGKVVHDALEEGCDSCHQTHGSAHEGLLQGPPAEVCGECHDQDTEDAKVVHDPVAEGSCPDCHLPHVAKRAQLLKLPVPKLCFECHDEADVTEAHQSVQGETKSCQSCHVAHASKKDHLLKGSPP